MFQCKLLQLHRHCVNFGFSVQVPNIHILGLHVIISISFKKGLCHRISACKTNH